MLAKRCAMAFAAGITGIALFATGCSSAQTSDSVSTESPLPSDAYAPLTDYPDQVIVYRPGMLDTSLTVDDVPQWPGPDPSEFLENPRAGEITSGESGWLSGQEAHAVYDAALEHDALLQDGQEPDELTGAIWAAEGEAQWLVVEPQG